MSQPHVLVSGAAAGERKGGKLWKKILASKFLFISIIAHLIFGAGATYFIVQRVQAGRKLTFQGGPPVANPSKRSLEHKVSMAKRKSGGAPPQAHRIVSTGLAKISLPEMPALPAMSSNVSSMMSGMGGVGMGQGMGFGNGMGGGMGGGSGGGGGLTMFGFHSASGGGLPGELYDLKQDREKKPSGMSLPGYRQVVMEFIKSGWQDSVLHKFYKAKKVLYLPDLCVPQINANLAPKAFDVEKEVQPKMWLALYKGTVTAPENGSFRLVGCADDIMMVRFNGRTVLNASFIKKDELGGDEADKDLGVKTDGRYDYDWPKKSRQPLARGVSISVQAGDSYPIEILIGEWPGGWSHFVLLIEHGGSAYDKTSKGLPILPIFRMADAKIPEAKGDDLPPHRTDGSIWRARAGSPGGGSILDSLNN